jgi:predicted nucleic acid-binding protein
MGTSGVLVFDAGPLIVFAKSGWLGVLKALVGERTALVPDVVIDELRTGVETDTHTQAVLESSWLAHRRLESDLEMALYAKFTRILGRNGRNQGEAGVMALAASTAGVAVIDDRVARNVARDARIPCRGSLALLNEGIQAGLLTVPLVSAVADDLLAREYRLPFKPGGFEKWAADQGWTE